jgi:phosphoribosylanthranilate isomerase
MSVLVKICGLKSFETIDAAIDAGADMVGFVFFSASPRNVHYTDARALAKHVGGRAQKVALTVNADDGEIAAIVEALEPDVLQLHGEEEPRRVGEIRSRYKVPIMKVIGVSSPADIALADAYRFVGDRILFDAKPPKDASRPGGNGAAFDWTILQGLDLGKPYMLSGGLTAHNVAEALRITGAPGVDISSGVERAPGEKDPAKIAAFVKAAKAAAESLRQPGASARP